MGFNGVYDAYFRKGKQRPVDCVKGNCGVGSDNVSVYPFCRRVLPVPGQRMIYGEPLRGDFQVVFPASLHELFSLQFGGFVFHDAPVVLE